MDRKATAKETLTIMERGYYEVNKVRVDIKDLQAHAVKEAFF